MRDEQGRNVGRLGGAFRLGGGEVRRGGGEVPLLHEGIAVSASDRQRAQAQCPGRFWIVGDVL